MTAKQIEILKTQISKLGNHDLNIDGWKSSTIILLERIFGNTYPGIKTISNIQHRVTDLRSFNGYYSNNINYCIQQGKEILGASITELESFGLPEKKENNSSGIKIEMNQNQTVNVSIILSVLEQELTNSQLDEIKKLMEADESKSTKRKKIIEKIKSFGKDIASNILGNILINPNIWG